MAIALAITGIAFAALCVWLTVRIVNRRERWAKRTLAAVVGLPVLYVASTGPVNWLASRELLPDWLASAATSFYAPVEWTRLNGPRSIGSTLYWWMTLLMPHSD